MLGGTSPIPPAAWCPGGVTVTAVHEATGNTFEGVTDGSGAFRRRSCSTVSGRGFGFQMSGVTSSGTLPTYIPNGIDAAGRVAYVALVRSLPVIDAEPRGSSDVIQVPDLGVTSGVSQGSFLCVGSRCETEEDV